MAGKPSPNDVGGNKKPPKTSSRMNAGKPTAPADLNGKKNGKHAGANGANGGDDLGLFVDAAPSGGDSKKAGRAADRRRERGEAPAPPGAPDTRRSMPQRAKSVASEPQVARATLQCTRGPEEGLTLQLMEGSYTIGRARENSFVLKDIAASRRHIRIDVDGNGARLVDLGSGNGSRLNGRRVSEAELRHGDRIEIGGSVLVFADAGQQAPKSDPLADDAQERVIRAAEKLAAELSERMRFGEGPQAGFEDGHVARTRALPKADKATVDAELRRASGNGGANGDKPASQRLWNETFTNMPLNEVVPANDPLRGTRGVPPPPPAALVVSAPPQRAPQQRAMPPPMPMPMLDERSLSHSRGGSSFMLSLLVSAMVVILGGAAVLAVYWITHRNNPDRVDDQSVDEAYKVAMDRAREATAAGDWQSVVEYAGAALDAKPGDPMAMSYKKDAKSHIDAALLAAQRPPTPLSPPQPVPGQPPQNLNPPGTPGQPVAQPPQQPPPQQPVAQPPPQQPQQPPAQPPPRRNPPPRRDVDAAPKPPPRNGGGRKLSEEQAQEKFEEAVAAMRNKDIKGGCRLLNQIAERAPADSVWRTKADNLIERRCEE